MLTEAAAGARASATMALKTKAKQLARSGVDVAMFALGEPDFDTPDHIKQAAHRALQSGFTKYTDAAGTPELRQAIAEKLARDNGVDYSPQEVLVSNGSKHALYQVMLCLVEDGDRVLLPAPYWVSYPEQVRICGAETVVIDTGRTSSMTLTADLLEQAVTEHSKVLVLNSPCNPSGNVLSGEEMGRVVEAALAHGLWIVSDEIYEKLIYDDARHVSPASLSEEARQRVITVNGFSNTYAMTGWRLGYAAGPEEIIRAAARLQSNMAGSPNSIAQRAAVEALTGPQEPVEEMRQAFDERRRLLVDGLSRLPGVSCAMPQGAFYAFPDCRQLLGKSYAGRRVDSSLELSEALLEQAHVATVPGSAFGVEGYVRFCYATSTETIEKGLERFGKFIESVDG